MRVARWMSSLALVLLVATPADAAAASASGQAFIEHIESLVASGLEATGVAGVAVALIEDGAIVWTKGFGLADREEGIGVTPDTVFNTGSISKTATAWGVMRLVEAGKLDLDSPANQYLERWKLEGAGADQITIRMLLSHTGGLGLPAVPEYGVADPQPSLPDALSNSISGVSITGVPGERFSYSGGGYMVLQLLIEDVTGEVFADYMKREVLEPLEMTHSSFRWPTELLEVAAIPYDDGRPVEYFSYVGEAAASLNASVRDLARLAAATLRPDDSRVLTETSLLEMTTPAPNAVGDYGTRYGLGYDLWSGGEGEWIVGHAGQNTGFGAMFWTVPSTGDGIAVLTNDSSGRELWKWVHCDWVRWLRGITWRGYCTDRPEWLPEWFERRDDSPEGR